MDTFIIAITSTSNLAMGRALKEIAERCRNPFCFRSCADKLRSHSNLDSTFTSYFSTRYANAADWLNSYEGVSAAEVEILR